MNRKAKLVFKILGLMAILLIYISNRPASDIIVDDNIWMEDYIMAKNKAEVENKPLLIYFSGSDWCKPCIQLREEVFDRDEFRSFAKENLVLLKLDFPRYKRNRLSREQTYHNEALAARFNREGSFPLVLVIDKHEDVLMQTGYRDDDVANFITYIKQNLAGF